jgi:Na+-transporting methylmalonyl-CoA/oxaloacetate decarboxylase gamma subunit
VITVLLVLSLIALALYGLARLAERIPWSGLG